MNYNIIVIVEGHQQRKTLALAGNESEAKARAREIAAEGFFHPDERSGALVFYPARRVQEVWVSPQQAE